MAITQQSGGDALDRAQEAIRILVKMELQCRVGEMRPGDAEFVVRMAKQVAQYGDKTSVSPDQLFWLRDCLEKYA